jgi:hypothetical protein
MKKRLLPLILLFSISGICFSQNCFVDSTAAIGGDGTSWLTAYNDLQLALNDPIHPDTIFIAKGTYKPAGFGGDIEARFIINSDLVLLGGFPSGGGDRDPAAHPTILSGDLNEDDILDDFETNREDNSMTVVLLMDTVQTVFDGLTISHGHAPTTEPDETGHAGGMYARLNNGGELIIRNCLFTQNLATRFGGGLFVLNNEEGGETPFLIENSVFQSNAAGSYGGGIHMVQWGDNSTAIVRGCQFLNNNAEGNGGGFSYFSIQNLSVNSFLEIEDCYFSQNSVEEFNGSALFALLRGENSNLNLTNSSFVENGPSLFGAVGIWGATWEQWAVASGTVNLTDCLFEDNTATYSAGLSWGSLEDLEGFFNWNMVNCDFIGNHATEIGGAMEIYGESASEMTIEGCNFIENSAGIEGGAISTVTNHPEFVANMRNCIIERNSSQAGAAIVANNFTEVPGQTQDAHITFENCLMTQNSGEVGSVNLYNIGTVKLLNCTIVDNPAGGIVQNDSSTLTLQNTIIANPGHTEYTAANDDVLSSYGGNLILDNSLDNLTLPSDQTGVAPGFDSNYFPIDGSNLVNSGINDGVTAMYDLEGNVRIQMDYIDIGAYESPYISVDVREVYVGEIMVSPNPTDSYLNVQLPNTSIPPFDVEVFNAMGSLLESHNLNANEEIDVKHLPSGIHFIKVLEGNKTYTGQFIKK